MVPPITYGEAVIVEDANEIEAASEEVIEETLLEQSLDSGWKQTRTKAKSRNAGCDNVPKYQYAHTHIETDPKMISIPKKV